MTKVRTCSDFFAVWMVMALVGTAVPRASPRMCGSIGRLRRYRPSTFPVRPRRAVSACHKTRTKMGTGFESPGGVTAGTDCDDDRNAVNLDPGTEEECSTTHRPTAMATQTIMVPPAAACVRRHRRWIRWRNGCSSVRNRCPAP